MIGDKLCIKDYHRKAADEIFTMIKDEIEMKENRYIITIGGESSSGKSEISHELSKLLNDAGITTKIIQLDDYFVYPPKTNHKMRMKNLTHIGESEVKLDLLNEHLKKMNYRATIARRIYSRCHLDMNPLD